MLKIHVTQRELKNPPQVLTRCVHAIRAHTRDATPPLPDPSPRHSKCAVIQVDPAHLTSRTRSLFECNVQLLQLTLGAAPGPKRAPIRTNPPHRQPPAAVPRIPPCDTVCAAPTKAQ